MRNEETIALTRKHFLAWINDHFESDDYEFYGNRSFRQR